MGKQWKQWETLFWGAPKSLHMVTAAMKLKDACSSEEKLCQPRQHLKKQRHYFANKGPSSQGYGFSSGHVWMWEMDYKENWAPKNWCFWTVVLEKTLDSLLNIKEIKPVHSNEDQSWVFIGRIDVEAETPILWPPHAKSWLFEKIWCWEWLRAEGEGDNKGWDGWMAYRFNRHGFGWTLEAGYWQGGLVCCGSWGSQRVGHNWETELNNP